MVGKIVCLVCCLLCSFPFFIISMDKDSLEPIGFWSGDSSLKGKVKDLANYNREMAALYKKCGWVFVATGGVIAFLPVVGTVLLILECTLGIYVVWRFYKKILAKYS